MKLHELQKLAYDGKKVECNSKVISGMLKKAGVNAKIAAKQKKKKKE